MKYRKLRAKMLEMGVDAEWLGRKIGLSAASFSHRMTGRIPWKMTEVFQILDILHLPETDLLMYFPRNG